MSYQMNDPTPVSPYAMQALEDRARFVELYKKYITREGADKLLAFLESSDFFAAPASTRYHGNHEGGLCRHSLNVYDALVDILNRLAGGGNTVVVIEHTLDVIKTADYLIDMGPEGGDGGGTVVVSGTPEDVAKHPASYTGKYVAKYIKSST